MNAVVAAYYATTPTEKVSELGIDVTEPILVRDLWLHTSRGEVPVAAAYEKVSELIEALGGVDAAQEKIDEGADWLRAWDGGERVGVHAATQQMMKKMSVILADA